MQWPTPVNQATALEYPVENALEMLSAAGIEERGAIFTKRAVVEFILDLACYTTDKPLHKLRLLEPSFGDGDFCWLQSSACLPHGGPLGSGDYSELAELTGLKTFVTELAGHIAVEAARS